MLKKENRLKSNRAFQTTYRNNNCINDKSIVLYIGQEKDDKNCPTRVGFVVSKKIHKRAVVRNRIKRLMRESVRLKIKDGILNNNFKSLIFIAKANLINKNFIEINKTIENLLLELAN